MSFATAAAPRHIPPMAAAASLHARDLRLALGRTEILRDVDLDVTRGRRIGLVGPNGVGKSTLLRVLGGELRVDRGTVVSMPPAANVGVLPQEPERRSDETVRQHLARRTGVAAAELELDGATTDLATGVD